MKREVAKRVMKTVIKNGAPFKVVDYELLSCGHEYRGDIRTPRDERDCKPCGKEPQRGKCPFGMVDRAGRFIPT